MEQEFQFTCGELYGVPYWNYLWALLVVLGGFVVKWLISLVLSLLRRAAKKTSVVFDDIVIEALDQPLGWAIVVLALFFSIQLLPFLKEPVDVQYFLMQLCKAVGAIIAIWFASRLTDGFSDYLSARAEKTESKLDDQVVPIARRAIKVFLVLMGGVLFLQNLGYSVGSLIAGVSVFGAALGFAAKDTLANVFGVFVIFMDKPFQVGDWIEVAGVEGTVEEINLRVTKIRTFANSLVTVPNARFTDGTVNNWSAMKKRRIMMTVGVTYATTPDQMDAFVDGIRDLIRENEKLHHDFFLVNFDGFGASSLDVFIYCFTVTTNWGEFLQAKQEFLLDIMRLARKMDLEIAFPTQTVHVASLPGEPPALTRQRPE